MKKYALIIGNDQYSDTRLAKLKTPAADTRELTNVLKDGRIGGFDEVVPVMNQTEAEARRKVSSFLSNKKPDDLVLVYFSGHGVLDGRGRLFLALKDTQTDFLSATAIPSSFLSEELDTCRSRRQILILDCCNSGAFARGVKAGDHKVMSEVTFEGNGYGRVVLAASDATQFAFEGDQIISQTELSLFTHFLIEGLKSGEADMDRDGYVSLDEWYDYTYSQVLMSTPRQIPKKWTYNQQGDLIIARNPHPTKKIVELPVELVSLLSSPYSSARESAVKELGNLLRSPNAELAKLARMTLEKLKDDDSISVSRSAVQELSSGRKVPVSPPQPVPLPDRGKSKKNGSGFFMFSIIGIVVLGMMALFLGQGFGGGGTTPEPSPEPTQVIAASSTPRPVVAASNTPRPRPTATKTSAPSPKEVVASVKYQNTKLREGPDVRFKSILDLGIGDTCTVIASYHNWYQVECSSGIVGWLAIDWMDILPGTDLSTLRELTPGEVLDLSPQCKKYAC